MLGVPVNGDNIMDGRAALTAKLMDDGRTVAIEIVVDDVPLAHIKLDPPMFEKTLHDWAGLRSKMCEGPTPDLDPGARLEIQLDPKWRVNDKDIEGHRTLSLRHPGFGWLSFGFPTSEAITLSDWLVRELPPARAA